MIVRWFFCALISMNPVVDSLSAVVYVLLLVGCASLFLPLPTDTMEIFLLATGCREKSPGSPLELLHLYQGSSKSLARVNSVNVP